MMGGLAEAVHGGKLVSVEWKKVVLVYVNHKCVPLDDAASNHRKALEIFADKVGLPRENIIAPGGSADGVHEAAAYEKKILSLPSEILPRNEEGTPVFDVLALGMGSDGHIGSLYPNRSEISRRDAYVLHVEQDGKPPSITLSLPVMNAAKEVVVLALGEKKAEALVKALKEDAGDNGASFPAQALHPQEDSTWILDTGAAKLL
ncbi:unnamed protein product [Prorocentrum cordatum]|uniref:6-phosphogluconolactonase n=1 Tax=Prorocentrum cordatum TaxID=2364126 RepID=A0ABN9XVY6_9DINO|nr:unnamed protein product [Polarella glacialis]